MSKLWKPITLRGREIRNRLAMAPMVMYCINGADGFAGEQLVQHYRARARAGTGLIIVEAASVSPVSKAHPNMIGSWDDSQIAGLSSVAGAIHSEGAAALLQLCFSGVKTKDPAAARVGPSPQYMMQPWLNCLARELTVSEILEVEAAHAAAANRAYLAGFDGVELHCTHGYLFGSFMDAAVNHRKDNYGGNAQNRVRIVTETVRKVRKAVPDHFIVGCRVGCTLPDYDHALEEIMLLDKEDIDYLHVSKNILMPPKRELPEGFPCNEVVHDAVRMRKHLKKPVIASSEIVTAEQARYLLDNGLVDMVSVGRGMLADSEWAGKARENKPIDTCLHCLDCQWRIDIDKCPRVFQRRKFAQNT